MWLFAVEKKTQCSISVDLPGKLGWMSNNKIALTHTHTHDPTEIQMQPIRLWSWDYSIIEHIPKWKSIEIEFSKFEIIPSKIKELIGLTMQMWCKFVGCVLCGCWQLCGCMNDICIYTDAINITESWNKSRCESFGCAWTLKKYSSIRVTLFELYNVCVIV